MTADEYLELYHLDTPELIVKHIECLKRNTKQNLPLISSLAEKLIESDSDIMARFIFQDEEDDALTDKVLKIILEDNSILGQIKDDVIFNYNRGEKETMEYLKGVKETDGKLDYSEINLEILDLMAERFSANKHKYPKNNMKKAIDKNSLVWAAFRHIRKMLQPIEDDPETYKEHLVAVLCNMSMLLDQEKIK